MVLMVNFRIFGILLKYIFAMIPKHDLTRMIFYSNTQIYKNIWCQEEIISKFKKQLIEKHLALFEIPYLLQSWELVYACHSTGRIMFVDHLGSLLVPLGALLDLH
jgi:hypothetical protein